MTLENFTVKQISQVLRFVTEFEIYPPSPSSPALKCTVMLLKQQDVNVWLVIRTPENYSGTPAVKKMLLSRKETSRPFKPFCVYSMHLAPQNRFSWYFFSGNIPI